MKLTGKVALLLLAATATLAQGCKKNDVSDPVSTNTDLVEIPATASSRNLIVTTGGAWKMEVDAAWLKAIPSEGSGETVVELKAEANESSIDRQTLVTVRAGKTALPVSVFQLGVNFKLSTDYLAFSPVDTPKEIVVWSKEPWVITKPSSADWISVSPSSGSGDTRISVTASQMTEHGKRSRETLKLQYAGQSKNIYVDQMGLNDPPVAPVAVSPADKATNVSPLEMLRWQAAADPDGDQVLYTVYLSDSPDGKWKTIAANINSTYFSPIASFDENSVYYWKVSAKDEYEAVIESRVYSFTTGVKIAYGDGDVKTYQFSMYAVPVHLIVTGDGFVRDDYAEGGAFDQAARTAIEAIFAVEPFTTYRDYFTVSKVAAYSQERGATVSSAIPDGPGSVTRNTAFKSTLEGGGSTGISCNYDKVFEYARRVPGVTDDVLKNTTVIVVINLDAYAGTCMMEYSGRSVSMCPMKTGYFERLVTHEAGGHGFGRLLDEYRYYYSTIPASYINSLNYWRGGDPWYFGANLSDTNDPNSVHWKHYINNAAYPGVDLFEGGYLYEYGIWRPEHNSCMNDNILYFNTPSREAIVRRIKKAAGEQFDLADFLNRDVFNPPLHARTASDESFVPLGMPVLVDK